jgi:hypothetical protein
MAAAEISTRCEHCGAEFSAVPKTSFLGFRKLKCPSCLKVVTLPMSTGYRVAFLILGLFFAVGMLSTTINDGSVGIPGLIPFLAALALFRDAKMRRAQVARLSPALPPASDAKFTAVYWLSLAAVFVFIPFAIRAYKIRAMNESTDVTVAKVQQTAAEIRKPGETESAAVDRASTIRGDSDRGRLQSAGDSLEFDAGIFFGYYFKYDRVLPLYCQQKGVSVPRFVSTFAEINAKPLISAQAILTRRATDPEDLYKQIKDQLWTMLTANMRDEAAQRSLSEADYCRFLDEHLDLVRRAMPFEAKHPDVFLRISSR